MALFDTTKMDVKFDTVAAQAFKDEHDAKIKAVEAEAEALTGKDNKKARTEKQKEAKAMKDDPKYIDACKVLKGLDAPNGNFMKKTAAAAAPKVEEKPAEEAKKPEEKKK